MAAVAATALYGVALLRLNRTRWAVALVAAFCLGSLAWPYSKIGIETTFMSLIALTLALVLLASKVRRVLVWSLAGFVAGAAAVAKPYALLAVIPLFVPLAWELRRGDNVKRGQLAVAFAVPFLVWFVAQGWYNWYRTGSLLSFGANQAYFPTLAAPFNLLGFAFSPGKSLFLYSPLAILGVLGLREVWRRDRPFALTIGASVLALTIGVSGSAHWTDEVWGPRYLVPVAWLLLLPIPWWYARTRRRGVLLAVAGIAVGVQLLGVFVPNRSLPQQYRALTGANPFYGPQYMPGGRAAPFGRDPYRWIPQLSPLLLRAQTLASAGVEAVTGHPLRVTYAPFLGPSRSVALSNGSGAQLRLPQVWWRGQRGVAAQVAAAALGLVAGLLWAWLLVVLLRGRPQRLPSWSP